MVWRHWRMHRRTPNSQCVSSSSFQKYSAANTKLAKLTNLEATLVFFGGVAVPDWLVINKTPFFLPPRCQLNSSWTWKLKWQNSIQCRPKQLLPGLSIDFFYSCLFIYFFVFFIEKYRTRHLEAAPHEYFTWEGIIRKRRANALVLHVRGNVQTIAESQTSSRLCLKGQFHHFRRFQLVGQETNKQANLHFMSARR